MKWKYAIKCVVLALIIFLIRCFLDRYIEASELLNAIDQMNGSTAIFYIAKIKNCEVVLYLAITVLVFIDDIINFF